MPARSSRKKATPAPKPTPTPAPDCITIRGARQNNLKGFDLDLPLGKLNVITGPSGSGKSSLAFQTIYAEGQRRYVETFSPYTRQFFERMDKPQVDEIRGIPPAIAIQQSNSVRTTRSTVGTMTEINDYLKLLWPRIASASCPSCHQPVRPDSPASIADTALRTWPDESVLVTFPVPAPSGTSPADFFAFLKQQGFLRVWLFGNTFRTDEPDRFPHQSLPAVVPVIQDRLPVRESSRLSEALETAFTLGKGKLALVSPSSNTSLRFSRGWHCASCDLEIRQPSPALFSFNNPLGACPDCRGFGRVIGIDLDRALPDKSLSIRDGLVKAFQGATYGESQKDLLRCAKSRGVSTTTPFDELPADDQHWILHGDPDFAANPDAAWESGRWYGVQGFFDYFEKKAYKMHVRVFLSRYRSYTTCRSCKGARLRPDSLLFTADGRTLPDWWQLPVATLRPIVANSPLPPDDHTARLVRDEITSRLHYLEQVGLGYLNLDRASRSLSGGEVMRVTLTTCLGASLVNTLFVLDEPSVGLHPRDTSRLIEVMRHLRDKGNTLLVVEHEESVMRAADNLIEIGPGRGDSGGDLVFHGSLDQLPSATNSLTADYLLGRKSIPIPIRRRSPAKGNEIRITKASQHNLRKIDVAFPLGIFCCVTGVSGSGKSTLVHEVLYENLLRAKGEPSENDPGACRSLSGSEKIAEVVMVDQSPPSRTPRSTPAVYTGAWDSIRILFADTAAAVEQKLQPGYFSFNSGKGRCGRCQGAGFEKVEMQFLSDIFVTCPECEGARFRPEALKLLWNGKNIRDVLAMSIAEAIPFFRNSPPDRANPAERSDAANRAAAALQILDEVGLGYLRLGQPLNTLSGGESQRLKLVGHLLSGGTRRTLFILDEPTTGLHFDDIALLLNLFQRLVDNGHSLIVIEHNMEVIKCADWLIDLGPEAGSEGGLVVAQGTPESVAAVPASHTGRFLRHLLPGFPARSILAESPGPSVPPAPAPPKGISIRGAREHNLKNISVEIPRNQFVTVTGLSGSGKSTLAFDIVFAEGQRRFLDSMSTYARQFVEQMERPEVDHVSGLPPTVAIEQRISRGGIKSTVATVTEIYHFLRLLYAKTGDQFCPKCHVPVEQQSAGAIVSSVRAALKSGPVRLCAPVIRGRKGFHTQVAESAIRQGYSELVVDGAIVPASPFPKLARFKEHSIDVVVASLTKSPPLATLDDLVQKALALGRGVVRILDSKGISSVLNTRRSCPDCGDSFDDLDPRLFSFNSPHGWCLSCRGYGTIRSSSALDPDRASSLMEAELLEEARREHDDADSVSPCPVCHGGRLTTEALNVRLANLSIADVANLPVRDAATHLASLSFSGTKALIARDILPEIHQRLRFLDEVGLGYLQLGRSATTLSGGESQRIRLAAQLGSNLTGVLYVLDEPTIGLHPRDNAALLDTLVALRNKGNSLLVVEHDEETMRRSDTIIDLGPGAGIFGGQLIAQGSVDDLARNPDSITGRTLGLKTIHPVRGARRPLPSASAPDAWLHIRGASANNLKNVDISIAIGRLTVITGISGSGKSSFMRGVLHPSVSALLKLKRPSPKALVGCSSLTGTDRLEAVYEVDQSPIGKTSRSTPGTYIKVFDEIRALFASLPASKIRGYTASRFSFNTEGGRCETCGGNGVIKHEMAFLPTSHVVCSDCRGLRYNHATLEIEYNDRSIGDVMNMTISEAADFFSSHPRIARTLRLLADTGTGYLRLGQPSPTLSGGEAQRLKLVAELSRGVQRSEHTRLRKNLQPKSNLYLIEEPTIGLHPSDVSRLLEVLHRLVDDGHTVVVIEHNLDVMAEADAIIDIGPEAGADGGTVVASGTPEQVATSKSSRTAPFLKALLARP